MTANPLTRPVSESPTASAEPRQASLLLASVSLWRREIVRFFRQKNRVVGSVATPFVFWVLLGFGFNNSFKHVPGVPGTPGSISSSTPAPSSMTDMVHTTAAHSQSYLAYFYPGTITLVLLFTAIFSTFTVIDDRREGFMQGILVAPTSRLAIVMGKVFGGASIATLQGLIFLLFWPLIAPWPGIGMMLGAVAVMFILSMALTALGFCFAWPCSSTAGFHAIMNLILMPMWFLSGAMFPVSKAPLGMKMIMYANPLTYGQELLTRFMSGNMHSTLLPIGALLGISLGIMVLLILIAGRMVNRPPRGVH